MTDEQHEHEHHEHVPVEYRDAIEGFREDKDDFFRTHARSPVPAAERAAFTGLSYFPIDEALRFEDRPLEFTYPGEVHVQMEAGEGQPSRWNTLRALRALRVLRWVEERRA